MHFILFVETTSNICVEVSGKQATEIVINDYSDPGKNPTLSPVVPKQFPPPPPDFKASVMNDYSDPGKNPTLSPVVPKQFPPPPPDFKAFVVANNHISTEP